LISVFDKTCAMLGSGTVMLLVLAPRQPAVVIAFLTLAIDLVGKLVSVTVMPMGNLVAPYLSKTSDDPAAQGAAAARVVKLSSLLYCASIGAGVLALPAFVPVVYGEGYRAAATLALLLLVPTAVENWIRGCCSPALLRTGRYRELLTVNILQAVGTLGTLALVYRMPVETVLVSVGAVRCAIAACNLALLAPMLPRGSYRVPVEGALIAAAGVICAQAVGGVVAMPGWARGLVVVGVFGAVFAVGGRWLLARDVDSLRIAHRIVAGRLGFLARFLPARPLNA
jgi:hypothetical protein